ncbi:MMPL family transporter [Flaviflexus equikiangi]|uniref:MMPL family transporter n=1 Tax=Flaviflexus equikiangi TaxID=2758573 RepID=A0ABS2TFG5_9ACTO|nr:MMPL family transporter [Flaviflexus equikiangi]MBM9433399.1 MMPL family transporter [Flaviflexus equikiangi]
MFTSLGRSISHRPRTTIVGWLILIIVALTATFTGFGGKPLFDALESGNPVIPGTESAEVYDRTQEDGGSVLFVVDQIPEDQIPGSGGTDVETSILELASRLDETGVVSEVTSYPGVVSAITASVESERESALTELEEQFAQTQAEIDALSQVDPDAGMVAQAELDAQREAAISALNAGVDEELDTLLSSSDVTGLLSSEGDGFVVLVQLKDSLDAGAGTSAHDIVVSELELTTAELQGIDAGIETFSQSVILATNAIIDQVQVDLVTGESVGLPIALFIMIIVFGGLLAAGLPLIGALSTIAVGMGAIWLLAQATAVDSFVLNIISIIGLGLSIDYGLLIVSRYREEIQELLPTIGFEADGSDIPKSLSDQQEAELKRVRMSAVETTVATAGRTVFFSALTIAVSIAALLVMDAQILQMIALGGVFTVLLAVIASISLIPALIMALGNRLLRPSVLTRVPLLRGVAKGVGDSATDHGFFSRLARFVHNRPWPILIAVTALLLVMTIPVSGMHLRSSYDEYVPVDSEVGQGIDIIDNEYPSLRTPEVQILADAPAADTEASAFVSALEDAYPDALITVSPVGDGAQSLIGIDLPIDDPVGPEMEGIVSDIRAMDSDVEFWVGGSAALQVDFNDSLARGLPLALTIIVIAVFVLLFLMTGSLMVPLKAILLNGLSLLASLGLTIWIFENGYLGFNPVAGLEAYVVAIALAFGFGLAMDYEVFLLARIKEYWDAGYSNDEAVERGLQRSGRIITSAAAIIIAVFVGFVFGDLIMIKQIGVALAIIVALDATLVRMLLVPATMTLLGRWNWWAPKPLVKLHERFGIKH